MPSQLPEVLCAGLACVDMELLACALPATVEAITPYSHARYAAGGCAPQTARALAALALRTAAVYPAADDAHGRTLRDLLAAAHVAPHPVAADGRPTALAVLPVFPDGRRGCYVSLGANEAVAAAALAPSALLHAGLRAFHCGYPHLLPNVQGAALRALLDRVRAAAPAAVVSLDVNGADRCEAGAGVLTAALPAVDLLHANLEEACVISGLAPPSAAGGLGAEDVAGLVHWFCDAATAAAPACPASPCFTVCVTCGKDGVSVGRVGDGGARRNVLHRAAYAISGRVDVNSSGAGDSFAAGSLAGLLQAGDLASTSDAALAGVADAGLASALNTLEPVHDAHRENGACGRGLRALLDALQDRRRLPSKLLPTPAVKAESVNRQ
jgi:sugar/nucleoside kinase (ribokinase family)